MANTTVVTVTSARETNFFLQTFKKDYKLDCTLLLKYLKELCNFYSTDFFEYICEDREELPTIRIKNAVEMICLELCGSRRFDIYFFDDREPVDFYEITNYYLRECAKSPRCEVTFSLDKFKEYVKNSEFRVLDLILSVVEFFLDKMNNDR